MIFQKTKFEGLFVIEPEIKTDERGSFARYFCKEELAKTGINFNIVQISRSFTNQKGTLRGMHFQKEPKAENKIVQCIKGAVYDVVIDLRQASETYSQWFAIELSEENKKMLLIPKGFAHGLQTLTDNCEVQYFMSEFYSPENATGVRFDDPFFKIKWPLPNPLLSDKDQNWPLTSR
jgi:dTDP-4-dehydrorhamnose 3,5-epimerase